MSWVKREKRNVVLVRDSTRSPTMSGSVNPDEAGAFGTDGEGSSLSMGLETAGKLNTTSKGQTCADNGLGVLIQHFEAVVGG